MEQSNSADRFGDKVVVVTGVSDRGIGGAVVERLSQEGAAIAALWMEKPRRVLKRLGRSGTPSIDVPCDVTDAASVAAAVDATMAEFGQIDVLINNAGLDRAAPVAELSDEDWNAVLSVNLTGVMKMTRGVLPYLTEPGGAVINVSSALSLGGCDGFAAYTASKAGVNGLTQTLAAELAQTGRRAVGVAPALVHTPMSHRHAASATEDELRQIEAAHPLGVGHPQDVAAAVAFLASDEARWITGTTIPLGYLPQFDLPSRALQRTDVGKEKILGGVDEPAGEEVTRASAARLTPA